MSSKVAWVCTGIVLLMGSAALAHAYVDSQVGDDSYDWQIPNPKLMLGWKDEVRIVFVSRGQNFKEWQQLKEFWNPGKEKVTNFASGETAELPVIRIKVPLGLNQSPPVPLENTMTLARWELGRRLFFDTVLSSDATISCASCHDPRHGYTDAAPFSIGIAGNKGGMSAPTVINTAYNTLQFWDGRALSLEDQAQGPVQNALEMFNGKGHAWNGTVVRIREKEDYVKKFQLAYGTLPTRDAIAKAIACYERTVLVGNSLHDRAEAAMRLRVNDEGTGKFEFADEDYATVLTSAHQSKDINALEALKVDAAKGQGKIAELAQKINNGRALFFGKARCSLCHTGDNFTDNAFHNLGVGVGKDGKVPKDAQGRFAILPVGHKNHEFFGAFKTPTLRGLASTGPYMHNGSEKTLEEVVDFYDRGGNANPFLDGKMRDGSAESAYFTAKATGTKYSGPEAIVFDDGARVVVPFRLNLTPAEKANLVLFIRALHGDPVPPIVADPSTKVVLK